MKYWKWIDSKGKTTTVQSCSNDKNNIAGAVEIMEKEFNVYIDSLPKPVIQPVLPPRDLLKELDDMKQRLVVIEADKVR